MLTLEVILQGSITKLIVHVNCLLLHVHSLVHAKIKIIITIFLLCRLIVTAAATVY